MALTEQQFIALEGNINEVWDAYFKHKKDYMSDFFNIVKKNVSQYTDYTVGAAGKMHDWNGAVQYDSFATGYEKQYKATKKDTGIQIDRDMYEDKEYERIKTRVNSVAYGVHKTIVYETAELFNKATSTEILGPDGKALCASDHLTVPGAAAQSNVGTNELNYDGVEASQLVMENWVDDRGDEMLIEGNLIIAGNRQRKNCEKLFGSKNEAFVGDNTKNVYEGMKYIIHPLIKGDRWFLVNEDLMKGGSGLNWFMRRDPRTLERDGSTALGDFNTEMLSWKAVGRWVKGWTNYFFVYGNIV
jgi:hypothetical protein